MDESGAQLILAGRLDVSTVASYRRTLHAAVDQGTGPVTLDLAGLEQLDATGLAMLLGTARRAEAAGRALVLRNVPPRVSRLLRLTRLNRVLREEPAALLPAG